MPDNPELLHTPLGPDPGAYEAVQHDLLDDPATLNAVMAELTRTNRELVIDILSAGKDALDQGKTPDQAYIEGSLIILGALAKQQKGAVEDRQLGLTEELVEVVEVAEAHTPRRRWRRSRDLVRLGFMSLLLAGHISGRGDVDADQQP